MKTNKLLSLILCAVAIFSIPIIVFAHPGRTDEYGGHYNWKTGEYHYHHGYPAHQHIDGYCPYDYDDQTDHSNHGGGYNYDYDYDYDYEEPIDDEYVKETINELVKQLYEHYVNLGLTHSEILQRFKEFGAVGEDTDQLSVEEFESIVAEQKAHNYNTLLFSPGIINEYPETPEIVYSYTVIGHILNVLWSLILMFFYGFVFHYAATFIRQLFYLFLGEDDLHLYDIEFEHTVLIIICIVVGGIPFFFNQMCSFYDYYFVKQWWYAVFIPLWLILQVRLTIHIIVISKKTDSENPKNEQECKNPTITAEETEQTPEIIEEATEKEEQPPEEVAQEEPKQVIKPTRKIYHYHTQSHIMPVDPKHVYWTANGKSYHSNRRCLALRNCATVSSGTLTKAQRLGHKTPCSVCVGKNYKVKKK